MAKEWILNNVMNRFQLNFKRNVGATSENIRKCKPKTQKEWEDYYFKNVRSKDHIKELSERLYKEIKSTIKQEVEDVTKEDCFKYMKEMVIDRTYKGYMTEIDIIKEILEGNLKIDIKEAPDEWDRLFAVDFYIKIKDKYIGLQIKPEDIGTTLQIFAKERKLLFPQHKKFYDKYGGKVFVVYSIKQGDKKVIQNTEVIKEIMNEIKRIS